MVASLRAAVRPPAHPATGESRTNHASHPAPRSSRVLLFYGYIILLASAVLFYSGQRLLVLLFLPRTFGDSQPGAAGERAPRPLPNNLPPNPLAVELGLCSTGKQSALPEPHESVVRQSKRYPKFASAGDL